jgi:hypothetical protein
MLIFLFSFHDVCLYISPYFCRRGVPVTSHEEVLAAFKTFTARKDIGILLISQFVRSSHPALRVIYSSSLPWIRSVLP